MAKVWCLNNQGQWAQIPDPIIGDHDNGDFEALRQEAGYVSTLEVCADPIDDDGYRVRILHRDNNADYEFYIEVSGLYSIIASIVARDFPQLLEVLQQMKPLLDLMQFDNVDTRARNQNWRDMAKPVRTP